jgi:DNA invertase Pin-like site-specific DNA recombinase
VTGLAEFRSLGIDFVSYQEALDTSTPMGKAMLTIIGAMAELERNVIRELIVAGLDHAKAHGTKSGAAVGRRRAIFERARVVGLRAAGRSWGETTAALGVSVRSDGASMRKVWQNPPRGRWESMVESNGLRWCDRVWLNQMVLARRH